MAEKIETNCHQFCAGTMINRAKPPSVRLVCNTCGWEPVTTGKQRKDKGGIDPTYEAYAISQ